MTLHEKGRNAFKKSNYSLALLFFHEADEEYKYVIQFLKKQQKVLKSDNFFLVGNVILKFYKKSTITDY